MEAARHLHAVSVDAQTGEVIEGGCPDCIEKTAQIDELTDQVEGLKARTASLAGQVTRAKNELAGLMAVAPNHDDILEVMTFWRDKLAPNASIVIGSDGWKTVGKRLADRDAQTDQPRFTPLSLTAAIVGMSLDAWHMDLKFRHRRYLENAFRDPGKVDRLILSAVSFKRRTGISALTLLDELGAPALSFLADRCSCGGLRIAHLMGQGCGEFDEFAAKVERHLAGAA